MVALTSASCFPEASAPLHVAVSNYSPCIAGKTPHFVRKAQERDYKRHIGGYVVPPPRSDPLAELTACHILGLGAEMLRRGLSLT